MMGAYMSNIFGEFNIKDKSFYPGTKFKAKDNNIYVFLGYSYDINNFICIKDDYIYNNHNTIILSINDIKSIIYESKPLKDKKHTEFLFA